ncbi:TOBE domain-containing protein [Nocardia carnea]|uniref:TOBE domain-containing protein n=1 Tax=Nocardia carnea TaxID=37328 RepID=UPI003D76D8BA
MARLRPDDVLLHAGADEVPLGNVALHAELVTYEYGGRYFDVTVETGGEQLILRAPAAQHSAALRGSRPGAPLVVSFSPASLRVFAIPGDEPTAAPEPVAVSAGGHA